MDRKTKDTGGLAYICRCTYSHGSSNPRCQDAQTPGCISCIMVPKIYGFWAWYLLLFTLLPLRIL